ncbi:MAG TPA: hypothetical protein VIU37_07640 [Candidatus Limnocylindrales bacterium]|jgi:hypothetical protein
MARKKDKKAQKDKKAARDEQARVDAKTAAASTGNRPPKTQA